MLKIVQCNLNNIQPVSCQHFKTFCLTIVTVFTNEWIVPEREGVKKHTLRGLWYKQNSNISIPISRQRSGIWDDWQTTLMKEFLTFFTFEIGFVKKVCRLRNSTITTIY
jgi:hypothetical protein